MTHDVLIKSCDVFICDLNASLLGDICFFYKLSHQVFNIFLTKSAIGYNLGLKLSGSDLNKVFHYFKWVFDKIYRFFRVILNLQENNQSYSE